MTKTGQYRCIFAIHWLAANGALALVMFVLGVICASAAQAQTYTVLHNFRSGAGAYPYAGVVGDLEGNLYGTTFSGGASAQGTVFKLDKTGETVLYSFTGGADGALAQAGVVRDSAGNLYGTTIYGGTSGQGVVFKLDTTGKETVLHSFTRGADGGQPQATVIRDPAGNLYGTTYYGGSSFCNGGCGVVFKLDTAGTETVLHTFTGRADGANPGAVIRDSAGNLYGTTYCGGTGTSFNCGVGGTAGVGWGVVYKLDTTGKETVLYSFTGGADGALPFGSLILDSAGNLYGTTSQGGTSGKGVVFKLDTTGAETVLVQFHRAGGRGIPLRRCDPGLGRQSVRHD